LSYTKGNVYDDVKYTFSSSIVRLSYLEFYDYYSLFQHLDSIGKDYNTSIINIFSLTEAERILNKIANSLKTFSIKVIDKSEWLDKYYPRKD
jgi:hypothetical protein